MANQLWWIALLVCVHAALSDVNVAVRVEDVNPAHAPITGGIVTVTGCGFLTYTHVACVWDDRFYSFASKILDDNTIECETPHILLDELSTNHYPVLMSMGLVFDGDARDLSLHVVNGFSFGPVIESITPSSGFVAGGEEITISGRYFRDPRRPKVLFNGKSVCELTGVFEDNELVECIAPAGEFASDVSVELVYGDHIRVLSPVTYHYGPVITSVTPPCGRVTGGTIVTVSGRNFNEPLAGIEVPPFPAGTEEQDVRVEVVFNETRTASPSVVFDGNQLLFVTPTILSGDVFNQDVLVEVYFRPFDARALTFTFFYGAFFDEDALSSTVGHQGGGDRLTLTGCGLSQFVPAQLNILIEGDEGFQDLCFRGTGPGSGADSVSVTASASFAADRITCVTAEVPCTEEDSLERAVVLEVVPALPPPFQIDYTLDEGLFYSPGPVITGVNPTNGAFLGGQTVSILGARFFKTATTPTWRARVHFTDESTGNEFRRLGNILGDGLITTISPTGLDWGTRATITVEFFNPITGEVQCADVPRDADPPVYTFGPQCNSVAPSTGKLTGGQLVTLTGNGFLQGRSAAGGSFASVTSVRMCLERLNPDEGVCEVFEEVSKDFGSFIITDDELIFRVPDIRQGIETPVGGNRLFGDVANVFIGFEDVPTDRVADGLPGSYVECGAYQFTPVVETITPNRAPSGAAETVFVVNGRDFNDNQYNQNLRVDIGTIQQDLVRLHEEEGADTGIIGVTTAGGISGQSEEVIVTFDTCNTTTSATQFLRFGPQITLVLDPVGNVPSITEDENPRQDSWGWHPNGGQEVRVRGNGFEEYAIDLLDRPRITVDARCIIDGSPVETWLEADESGIFTVYDLVCVTPERPFSTEAVLEVEFGRVCATGEIARNVLAASQRLRYTPRIDSFTPEFGVTSGGTPVTIVGEGFVGAWANYECIFGAYSGGDADVNVAGTVLTCATPRERGQFNTDVAVAVQLSRDEDEESFRVQAENTYHYGPICFDVAPNNGRIGGGYPVSLIGQGFLDCIDSDFDPISNCQIENFFVNWNDADTGALLFRTSRHGIRDIRGELGFEFILNLTMPAGSQCMQNAVATIEYVGVDVEDDSQRFVQCTTPPTRDYFFHYGPLYDRQFSAFHRGETTYGWDGTALTIFGKNFQDPDIYRGNFDVKCDFGDRGQTPAVVLDDEQLTCQAPPGVWNLVEQITVEWSGSVHECVDSTALEAGLIHYGPVIDSITPDRGSVAGLDPITISGFAFGCCGITSARCMFPGLDELTSVVDGDTITCPVPENNNIDRQINNIGVRFIGNAFGIQEGNAFQTTTEDVDVLTYFYGPRIDDVFPTQVRLSGGSEITVVGVGFKDPYFDGVFCDFLAQNGGFSDVGVEDIFETASVTDTQIVCRVKEFNHECGAVDHFRPRWHRSCGSKCNHRTDLGEFYYRTEGTLDPSNQRLLPYYSDAGGGADIVTEIRYGPTIVDVSVNGGDAPINNPRSALQSWSSGGLEVIITADDLGDWTTVEPDNGYGSETALCLFGGRRAVEPSAIIGNSVVCETPPGPFGEDVSVSLLLDPKFTELTILEAVEDGDPSEDAFHWLPFTTSISQSWATVNGFETFTLSGGGFCNYDTVVCIFGDDLREDRFTVEGDIVNDHVVQCVAPPHGVGTFEVFLQFCKSTFSCDCEFGGDVELLDTGYDFTFAGVTGIEPVQISECAPLRLTVQGNGFSAFTEFRCIIDGVHTLAEFVNDNEVVCTGGQLQIASDQDPATCGEVVLEARANGRVHHFVSPVHVEFGMPQLLRVDPNRAEVDRTSEIVIQGRYFEGADPEGDYWCVFGNGVETKAEISFRRIGNDDDDDAGHEVIRCRTPTINSHPGEVFVGETTVEVRFDCEKGVGITNNRLPFTFLQFNTEIQGIFPFSGFETGGTRITVFGNNFSGGTGYFCSFGEIDDDDDARNNENQLVTAHFVAEGVEESGGQPVLTCISPANKLDATADVDFHITIDAGETYVRSDSPFTYTNVPTCTVSVDAAAALHPSLFVIVLLAAFLLMSL